MEIIPRCEGREIHLLRRGYFLCFDIFLEPAVWLVWNSWFRIAIRLYSLWIYNGGIDAQNAHFQTDKSQNELHYLKFSSIYSFWTKIKRPSVLQPTVKRIYGTKKVHFFH